MMEVRAMRRTTLSHPPLTILGYTPSGRPIRFIGGGSEPTPDGGTPPPPPADPPKPAEPPATGEDKLGDAGKKALAEERAARKAAEKQLADLTKRVQEFEDRDKSELEKATAAVERLTGELASATTERLRLQVAAEHEIPKDYLDLLTATDETALSAQAEKVAALVKAQAAGSGTKTLPGQGTPPAAPTTGSVDSGRALYAARHKKT